jgi:hypothetical protein
MPTVFAEQDAGVGAVGVVDQSATTNKGVTPAKATDKGVLPAAPPASDAPAYAIMESTCILLLYYTYYRMYSIFSTREHYFPAIVPAALEKIRSSRLGTDVLW